MRRRAGFKHGTKKSSALAGRGVSGAIHLRDPDCNGVELYRDRPQTEWPRNADGALAMVTNPLDLGALLREAPKE